MSGIVVVTVDVPVIAVMVVVFLVEGAERLVEADGEPVVETE